MLVAMDSRGRGFEAEHAPVETTFWCPGCLSEVILKKGRIRTAHFAHMPPTSCSWAVGESAVHLAAKSAFKKAFTSRGLRSEIEFVVNGLPGDRRADVMVWSPTGKKIAIEVQHSSISLDDLYRRTQSYALHDIGVVWVPVLPKNILADANFESGEWVVDRYAAPHWQRWISGYGFGRAWFLTPDLKLWKGKLEAHEIYVDESSWYEDGSEVSAGGYWRTSRRWKTLKISGPFDLSEVRLKMARRKSAELGKHRYPGGVSAQIVTC